MVWIDASDAHNGSETARKWQPTILHFKDRESGAWVAHTAACWVRVSGAWVARRPKRWNGTAWVDLL